MHNVILRDTSAQKQLQGLIPTPYETRHEPSSDVRARRERYVSTN